MSFKPRPYQVEAINAGVKFFRSTKIEHALLVCPTGSGKSVIIANICSQLEGKTVVFQPSKEILEQNFMKFISYGYRAGIYSASAGMKFIDTITFATIGSVANKPHLFRQFKNIIIDECHLVNAEAGMYRDFISSIEGAKVLGLTATPYRLTSSFEGSMLKFLTRTNPRIFSKVLYYIQNKVLFDAGFLAPLRYFVFDLVDRSMLELNKTGSDFTEASVRSLYKKIDMPGQTADYANRLLKQRQNVLVFSTLISEANRVKSLVPGSAVVTGETEPAEREMLLKDFKRGRIRCLINVGVLTTGFDYPALECVLIARSTMSLALYYQIVGRVIRPYKYPDGTVKTGWIIDLGGNVKFFGKVEDLWIDKDKTGRYVVSSNGKQLTNVTFTKK